MIMIMITWHAKPYIHKDGDNILSFCANGCSPLLLLTETLLAVLFVQYALLINIILVAFLLMYDIALQRYKCTCMYIEIRFQTTKNCHLHTIYESRTEGKTLLTSLSDYRIQLQDNGNYTLF